MTFRANGFTRPDRAADLSLRRCAELALENGFRYFAVVGMERKSEVNSYTAPLTSETSGSVNAKGGPAQGSMTTTTYGGQTYYFYAPSATNLILCHAEKPQVDGVIFDAELVKASIRGNYGITK